MPDDARPALDSVNSFDFQILQDPHPYFTRLREEAPVYRDPNWGFVSVATYELVTQVCAQPKLFSNGFGEVLRSGSKKQIDPEELAALNIEASRARRSDTSNRYDGSPENTLAGTP